MNYCFTSLQRSCKVKRGNLERDMWIDFVRAAQQDCAGGPERCWCRSCSYANSKATNIADFAVVSRGGYRILLMGGARYITEACSGDQSVRSAEKIFHLHFPVDEKLERRNRTTDY